MQLRRKGFISGHPPPLRDVGGLEVRKQRPRRNTAHWLVLCGLLRHLLRILLCSLVQLFRFATTHKDLGSLTSTLIKKKKSWLEIWLSNYEHQMLFLRAYVHFSASTRLFTTIRLSSPRKSNTLFWSPQTLHEHGSQICIQEKYLYT